MAKNTNVETLCDRELLEKILSIVERQEKLPSPAHEGGNRLYDNKSLMEKLNIKDKYLKKPEFWISNFPSIEDNSRKTLLWRTSRSPLPYVYV